MDAHPDTALIDERAVVLASPRRQRVLYYLAESDGAVTLDELSRQIAAAEADFGPQSVDTDAVRRVHDTLYMTHLPVLMEHGLVEYDYEHGVVRATEMLEDFFEPSAETESVSAELEPDQGRWSLYYLIPAVALAAFVVSGPFEATEAPLSGLPLVALVGVAVLLALPLVKSDAWPCLSCK